MIPPTSSTLMPSIGVTLQVQRNIIRIRCKIQDFVIKTFSRPTLLSLFSHEVEGLVTSNTAFLFLRQVFTYDPDFCKIFLLLVRFHWLATFFIH